MGKTLILIRGLSGAGKATLAEIIVNNEVDRVAICADDFFLNDDGEYNFKPDNIKQAHKWCLEETSELLDDPEVNLVVVHNTFTRKFEVDPYRDLAHNKRVVFTVVNLYDAGCNDGQLSQRSQYDVPSYIIQKQRQRWEKDVYRENNRKKTRFHNAPRGRHPYSY
jgi:predicted kinase